MPTTSDLRDLLHERAEAASDEPPPVAAAIAGGQRVRSRRWLAAGASALAVVAAIALPLTVGWPTGERTPAVPQATTAADERVTSSSGMVWAASLPGLELPEGAAMTIPYSFDTTVIDGTEQHELGGVVRRLLDVPEGLLALVDVEPTTPDANGPHLPTRIVLIVDDGTTAQQKELDRGYISSLSASETGVGPTRIAWTWTDASADTPPTEVRTVNLATGGTEALPLAAESFVWGFDGRDPILETDHGADPSFLRWDTESGALVPMPEHFSAVIAANADLTTLVNYDQETECTTVVRADQPDTSLWERCDLTVQTLSPDGKFALGSRFADGRINETADELAVVDLATGADVAAFDLPPSGLDYGVPRAPTFFWFVESWEPDGSALVFVAYEGVPGEDPDSNFAPQLHTLVRCSVPTGTCELVPDPVEVVASRT